MKVAIFRSGNIVAVNGFYKPIDTSTLPEGVKSVQWNGGSGYIAYSDGRPNKDITSLGIYQSFVDDWNIPAQLPNQPDDMIAKAHQRIINAYELDVQAMTAGYPDEEIKSWPKQEAEARAWLADNNADTPWIDGAYPARGITKAELVDKIIENADLFAPIHGALTGKRQKLRDEIDALGQAATQGELDSIQW